jgi:hypothetical protein
MSSRPAPPSSPSRARLRVAVAVVRSAVTTLDRWLAVGGGGVALARCADGHATPASPPAPAASNASAGAAPRLPVVPAPLRPAGARP